ncbi:MAG: hypothetical protein HY979_02435 [Candidatus Magasanikbacteria bacterium]|nr:hypothetical protein [Candidatus Magasanikbacteria bacterium]
MMNKKFLIIILLMLVIFLVGGFIWFRHKNSNMNISSSSAVAPAISPKVIEQESKKLGNNLGNLQKVLDEKQKIDSDLDGLSNDEEKNLGTDPNKIDTDGDGITDYDEVKIYHTNPLKADTDGDGYSDGAELRRGYNPLGPGKLKK